MNKKLVALLIPLLLLPLVAFAYAHWTDSVFKQYKFRFGTVEAEIKKWHVDSLYTWDADSDTVIWGDEFNVTEVLDTHVPPEVIGLQISAAPVGPDFKLEFKMIVHNKGRLPMEVEAPLFNYSKLYTDDPCFGWIPKDDQVDKPDWLVYTTTYYAHNDSIHLGKGCYDPTHFTIEVEPTGKVYEPCESVMIKQNMWFNVQGHPELQCHWFRIDVLIPIRNSSPGGPFSSFSGKEGWYVTPP